LTGAVAGGAVSGGVVVTGGGAVVTGGGLVAGGGGLGAGGAGTGSAVAGPLPGWARAGPAANARTSKEAVANLGIGNAPATTGRGRAALTGSYIPPAFAGKQVVAART
jgi:hypothetical protein